MSYDEAHRAERAALAGGLTKLSQKTALSW